MPRLPYHEALYAQFKGFLQSCWLEDRSLLWPDQTVWSITTLEAMRRRFVEMFMEGRLSFREKFEAQLEGASAEVWAMAADCFYVYGLGSHSIRFSTKVDLVTWCAQRAGLPLPGAEHPLWEALKGGVAATGQKYNLKHAQIRLLTLAGLEVKALSDRQAALESPEALQALLDGVLESISLKMDRANDMRNVILYLAFPEHYEPIVSNRDKDAILLFYQNKVKKKLSPQKLSPDRDAALLQVRSVLAQRFEGASQPFDFFGELRGEWRSFENLERALARENVPARGRKRSEKRASGAQWSPPVPQDAGAAELSNVSRNAVREPEPVYRADVPDPDLRHILAALRQTPNLILTGPPGVGKTYLADLAARQVVAGQPENPDLYLRWVTFHPSYGYEDFVEGLRPVLAPGEQLAYEVRPGIFREICERASADPGRRYVLGIDEINRGNLARILGELISLLEADKRGRFHVRLPYSGLSFTVPANLVILGTMNTTDRSIAMIDAALRRRFAFVEIRPRPDLLAGVTVETEEASVRLDALLRGLNAALTRSLDSHHQIGHSYFLPVARARLEERLERLEFAWNQQVLPLLEEYFYARPERLKEILAPFAEEGDDWGEVSRLRGEDLVVALSRVSD